MNKITYTFVVDFSIAELAGKTVTGGRLVRISADKKSAPEEMVLFDQFTVGGKKLNVRIAGRPRGAVYRRRAGRAGKGDPP